ncbi:MAG TPA: L,D-transpeptidase [Pyrinomonadaceae bacterium]|nr:L,D-transpeptidase [Pyrinomonadaceae bacterium]
MILLRRLLILSFMACLFASCTTAPTNSNTATVQPTPSPSVSPTPTQTSDTASVQVTLPLLDALLTDEKFVNRLKTNLKVSDEQIDSLKRASAAEITRLRESNAEDVDGNGDNPRERAAQELRSILGEDKARQLGSLANEYWSRGDEAEASGDKGPEMLPGPNAVPTDTRVVVNIPAFRMDLFENGTLVKSYKVGIGYPEFPLPQGMRKAQTIIFNPTWTPPDSPWVADMKNVAPGETVKAGDKNNPLGPIKIPIGQPSLIHGGKSPAKIGKFASHGCVGLTNNQIKDFATLLSKASNTDLSDTTLASYLEDKEQTKTVKLNQTVPVELRYETIVLEDGKLHIYKDVYVQDTNTEENLRKVLEAQGVRFEDLSEQQRTEALNALNAMSANPQSAASASPSPEASPAKKSAAKKKSAKNQNEIVIDLGGIAKKGYPAPVNFDTGSGKPSRG